MKIQIIIYYIYINKMGLLLKQNLTTKYFIVGMIVGIILVTTLIGIYSHFQKKINNIQNMVDSIQKQIIQQNYKNVQINRKVLGQIAQKNNLPWIQQYQKEIDNKINSSIQRMIEIYRNFKTSEYLQHPPKNYLQNLKIGYEFSLNQKNNMYFKATNQIKKLLSQLIQGSIRKIESKLIPFSQRTQIRKKIQIIFNTLPDDIKQQFKLSLEKVNQKFKIEQKEYISETIKLYNQVIVNTNKNIQSPTLQLLYHQLIKSMNDANKSNTNNPNTQIHNLKANYINQIKKQIQKFKNWKIQQNIVEISFSNINFMIKLSQSNPQFDPYLENLNYDLIQIHDKIQVYLTNKQLQFKQALQNFAFEDLKDILGQLKTYQMFVQNLQWYLQQCLIKDPYCKALNKRFDNFNYANSLLTITTKIQEVKKSICSFKFLEKSFEDQKIAQFQQLNTHLEIMINVNKLAQYIGSPESYKKESYSSINKKLDRIISKCSQILKNEPIQKSELIQFNNYYNSLNLFISKVNTDEFADYKEKSIEFKEMIKQKIKQYSKICDSPNTQIKVLAQTLIKMKQMSMYMIIFRDQILENLDRVIKKFISINEGEHKISFLVQFLQKDQKAIGMKIIDQHKTLKDQSVLLSAKILDL